MRIAMVSEHASPLAAASGLGGADAGGQNVAVRALALALADAGHEIVVHTRRTDRRSPRRVALAQGVTVDHVDAGPPRQLPKDDLVDHMDAFSAELAASWRADRPDVVHAHFWMSGLAALPAARVLGVPVVQTFHALGSVKRRHQGADDTSPARRVAVESDLGASVDRVLATCREEVDELVALGVPADQATVVPCGVDVGHFTPGPGDDHRGFRVLSVSRLVPRKGVDTVISALARLPRDAELVIAGGPALAALDDDPEVARLRSLASSLGVADRVRFLGAVGHDALPALYRSADAVACVPAYEPFGLVPLEAMACARPVVAAAVGGLADTVVDGVTGHHVPAGDPGAVAAALERLRADPRRARRLGRAGRRRAETEYGWDQVAAAHERVYGEVAAAVPALSSLTTGSPA
ncbi:glycosyltransferase involved in cell wall biosynthesis [Actinomycetospora succinea]|uniref:Glycosyltransferase involved in cell wall biosynthesis n=1 Tax=Actinomycetospora succinea TaxID=663603 RepID=A0A4R6UIX3_9PSEU|nr:glycosyltransferase [Actinomycetospora succinea]TDQ46422.1 glycosyltransferase involved in cell wall biosynthesis [Actinomycetospora succinea]